MDVLFGIGFLFLVALAMGCAIGVTVARKHPDEPQIITETVEVETDRFLEGFEQGFSCKEQGYAIERRKNDILCTKIVAGKPVVVRVSRSGEVRYLAGAKVGARRTNVPMPQEPNYPPYLNQ